MKHLKSCVRSAAAVRYGFEVLKQNQRLLVQKERAAETEFFQKSVLFPAPLKAMKDAHAAQAIVQEKCTNCGKLGENMMKYKVFLSCQCLLTFTSCFCFLTWS